MQHEQSPQRAIFSDREFERRWNNLRAILSEQRVDLAILTDADTIFYYSAFAGAASTFQALLVPLDEEPVLMMRYAEESTFQASSWLKQSALYNDWDDPQSVMAELTRILAPKRSRIAVEKASYFMSARRFERIVKELRPREIIDVSDAIGWQRMIKSDEEIAMYRRSAAVIDTGMAAGVEATQAGATERDIAAAIAPALIRAGADAPNVGIIASGERLSQVHGGLSNRQLQPGDLIRLEQSNSVNRYWTRLMRTLSIGEPSDEIRTLYERMREVQDEQLQLLRPGAIPAELDAHARGRIPKGVWGMQLSGYALTFHERSVIGSEIDQFRIVRNEVRPIQAGMVLHIYLIFGEGIAISESVVVTDDGAERLTTFPRDLIVR